MVIISKSETDRVWLKSVKKTLRSESLSMGILSVEFTAVKLDFAVVSIKNINLLVIMAFIIEFLINMGPRAKGYLLKMYLIVIIKYRKRTYANLGKMVVKPLSLFLY